MCYDVQQTKQTLGTSVASVSTRDMVFTPDHHDKYPEIDFPEEFRIDTKPFVNRPFFVESFSWSNEAQYSLLPLSTRKLPTDVFTSNTSLEFALKLGAYFRSDLSLNISIAGTISHAGALLVGILPPMPNFTPTSQDNKFLINTFLSGPHCFLHANEATSAVLHVPWYCNTDVASLDIRPTLSAKTTALPETNFPGNFATLAVMVLNPLSPSQGASTSLSLVVEACFSSLDIFVPSPKFLSYSSQGISKIYSSQGLQSIASSAIDATTSYVKGVVGDAIDVARAGIKYYTGLHNPNIPLINNRMIVSQRNFPNNTTGEQFFEKLDPYPEIDRIVDRPIFNTNVDEMSMRHILSKPQYLGSFKVIVNDGVGKLLWSKPISPKQGGLNSNLVTIANNIELIHYLSRAWRGSLNIHIQSVMNNKQQVKLRLIQLYNPPTAVLQSYPVYHSLLSAPTHLMEFTAGGQIQTINLPYLCRNQLTPCARDLNFEALFHGMYYIYLAQPLVISSDSPTDVNFNVYISGGDDLTFHGYATEPANLTPLLNTSKTSLLTSADAIVDLLKTTDPDVYVSQGITVMNEPQLNQELTEYSTDIKTIVPHQERLYSPIDIRPLVRRMYQTYTLDLPAGPTPLNLDQFLSERTYGGRPVSPLQMVSAMYYGKSAGFKIKIKIFNSADLQIAYVPVQYNADNLGKSIRASTLGPLNQFSPYVLGTAGYAVPFQEMAQETSINTKIYEFVIPNTNFYKFVGGPEKFQGIEASLLSVAGVGHLLIWSTIPTTITLYVGCTDESRFGFHSVAPIITPIIENDSLSASIYTGTSGGNSTDRCRTDLNPYVYYTRS